MPIAKAITRRPHGSLAHIAFLRQLQQHPSTPIALQLAFDRHPGTKSTALAASYLFHCQRRLQSTTQRPGKNNAESAEDEVSQPPPPPRQTLTRVLLRGLLASFRSLGAPFQPGNLKKLYRDSPEELVLALVT